METVLFIKNLLYPLKCVTLLKAKAKELKADISS